MTRFFVSTLCLIATTSAVPARARCPRPDETKPSDTSAESYEELDLKSELLAGLEGGYLNFTSEDETLVRELLRRPGTVAISFGDETGQWLSIADGDTGQVLLRRPLDGGAASGLSERP